VLGLVAPDDSGATPSGDVAAGGDISATTPLGAVAAGDSSAITSGAVKAGVSANIEQSQGADEKREDSEGPPKAKRAKIEKDPDRVHATKLAARNVPSATKAPRLVATGIELTVLTGTVNRFRLVGPLSAPLLSAVCRPAAVVIEASNNTPDGGGGGENTAANLRSEQRRWWKRFYADPRAQTQLAAQSQCMADLSDPAQGVLQGCTVRDPRLLLPVRRPVDVAGQKKAESSTKLASADIGQKVHNVLSDTPFFSTEIRWAFVLVSRRLKNRILGFVIQKIMDLDAFGSFYHCTVKKRKVALEKL
jgi:hypothetical protein